MSDHPFGHYWIVTSGEMTVDQLETAARYLHKNWCGSFDGGSNRKIPADHWDRITDDHKRSHARPIMDAVEALRHIGWVVEETP